VVWTLLAVVFLYGAVHQGLLLRPDMQVEGGGSSDTLLQWYQDRVEGALPAAWVSGGPMVSGREPDRLRPSQARERRRHRGGPS